MLESPATSFDLSHIARRPGLLVSVRDEAEALTAWKAGADVIDVKEPAHGSLGAADAATIESVVRAVADQRPVTVALGELGDLVARGQSSVGNPIVSGVSLFKIGLAGCGDDRTWRHKWHDVIAELTLSHDDGAAPRPVAVAYADWKVAASPDPEEVLNAAVEAGCPALLVDTWLKNGDTLFNCWEEVSLREFLQNVQRKSMWIVLAGSLDGEDIARAAMLGPDLVAVRGAACKGGRDRAICGDRVRELKRILSSCELEAKR